MPIPLGGFNPFDIIRGGKLVKQLKEEEEKAKKAGANLPKTAGLSSAEEELIARVRSDPLKTEVSDGRGFAIEHMDKIDAYYNRIKEHPQDLKAALQLLAQKSTLHFSSNQASLLAEHVVSEYLEKGRNSMFRYNLASNKIAHKLRTALAPFKKGSVQYNSVEGILRNAPEFADLVFDGYQKKIQEIKNQG